MSFTTIAPFFFLLSVLFCFAKKCKNVERCMEQ
jgi:hypothetical protein